MLYKKQMENTTANYVPHMIVGFLELNPLASFYVDSLN